jgi:hypothetical protein
MEATRYSETSLYIKPTWLHMPEVGILQYAELTDRPAEWYKQLRGLSPRENYSDRETAACLRS